MEAINANTRIYDRTLDRAAMIRLHSDDVNGKVELVIDGHVIRVDNLIKKSNFTVRGFKEFQEAVDLEIRKTFKELYNTSKRSMLDLVADQASYTYQTIEANMGRIWRTKRPQRRIAEEIVLERPLYSDKTLEAGWQGISIGEKKRIEATIRRGLSEGKSVDEIALAVRKGNVHTLTRFQARALTITAITSVQAQTDHAIYSANEKALRGWQYVAVLDSRTTPLCAHRDGTIYPITDTSHLPPAHFNCRSTTVPVFKSWDDIAKLEGSAEVRRRNLSNLTPDQIAFYDGQTPLRESYDQWLRRQPTEVQIRHLGDYQRVEIFRAGQTTLDTFTNPDGKAVGIRELRAMTDGYTVPNDTRRFAIAKEKLDAMQLGASTVDDFISNPKLKRTLHDYYLLQSGELDGTLSLTNYRGALIHTKKATKSRVLTTPPREEQLKFNPITGRYEDIRLYQPNATVYNNNIRLIKESEKLKEVDKEFILSLLGDLESKMSMNERAVVADNLRIVFGRQRESNEVWKNFKAITQGQIKYDVMNVSDAIETHIRKDSDILKKLLQGAYIDPVLGGVQLQELHDDLIKNIIAKNKWEDAVAPKIARELRNIFDYKLPIVIRSRLSERELQQFYLRFAKRLSLADSPDQDQFAIALGRDLYNLANLNGSRTEWYELGMDLLKARNVEKFFSVETFGVQKRRMKSRLSDQYFGPYYDTLSFNIRVTDERIKEYSRLTRKIELGMRIPATTDKNRFVFREGYKTYFIRTPFGFEDTRIPITSTASFSDFPEEFIDKALIDSLNWASKTEYKIDKDYYNFINKLIYFEDDKGKAKFYNELNHYKKYLSSRGDTYERLKAMEWLSKGDKAFSNQSFIDHRARIYDRGLIGPQSGEAFRPFLNTAKAKKFSEEEFYDFQDQIGAFLGGLSDELEGPYNSLAKTGRQKIALKWRKDMIEIGNQMLRAKPADIRAILENEMVANIDGEELGKFFRFAIESAKIDNYLSNSSGIPIDGRLVHLSLTPLKDTTLVPRVPSNFLTKSGFEDSKTKRVSFADNIDDALKGMSSNLKGKKIYVYAAPKDTRFVSPSVKQVPDVNITSEKWVLNPTEVELIGEINVGKAIKTPHTYTYGDKTADLYGWNWSVSKSDTYSSSNLKKLNNYKIALALEQDASSSGAQIIALTTRNKQLAELSNVIPTNQKKRLYDEIAAATFNDPRFRELNQKLGLTEKDLRKAAKAQNMVTFYGAGERTGVLNVEGKLSKALGKEQNTLVVKAQDRDIVLNEISARMARYKDLDPDIYKELATLRKNVKDIFNKGIDPGDDILEQLYFLDPKTRELVEKLSANYEKIVTPDDFKAIAKIMSEHLQEQVPILKDFTKFFGRLAEDYLANSKPSSSDFDWKKIAKISVVGSKKKGYVLPDRMSEFLGIKAGEPVSEKILKRFGFWKPNGTLSEIIYGVQSPKTRRTGAKYMKVEFAQMKTLNEVEIFYANKLPKSWTNVPWVNFDGKVIEQNFTQVFEERLRYLDKDGNWVTNILHVPQKTEATWWEQVINKSGKINDIADATKARTAFAVNGNHSNDAVIVKQFHLWGKANNIATSTIHDAFFTNAADMLKARRALRSIYANTLDRNVIRLTLDEMRARGLPKEIYDKYLNEAIEIGLIPVVGRSRINGKLLTKSDILTKYDILRDIQDDFLSDLGFYGVG